LTPNALAGSSRKLYEWAGGNLQLVNILPGSEGGTVATSSVLGNQGIDVRQAISSDGSRIIWSNEPGAASRRLYMRDMAKGETVRLDVAQQGVTEPAKAEAQFQTASDDGRRVFFTDTQRLTVDSTSSTGEPDLYGFETTSSEDEPLKGMLTDLAPDRNEGESADVQGLLPGASANGSYVYLVATGVLSEAENAEHEKAAPGADNLYVLHDTGMGWTTTFIARLSGDDVHDWTGGSGGGLDLAWLTSRVSPNGRYLAFMSDRELTGYDNEDVTSEHLGERMDEEVFLYDASAGRLICASCDPTGARPVGMHDEGVQVGDHQVPGGSGRGGRPLVDEPETWKGSWLAANIPGWTSIELTLALYQSRYLSDSGRLFFNSSDALVPQDVDGTEDVYQYEPSGTGSCGISSVTFSEGSGGCVDLISSGSSAEESVFLDASESGGDVFFLTVAKLAPQDYDTSLDVYDA
jgi:WD40-like Beta Propeller Repeat